MHNAGWMDAWQIAGALLVRQPPFVQILVVTLATLFVVMAIEGFRTSMLAIWRGHQGPAIATPPALGGSAAPSVTTIAKTFLFKPASLPVARRKVLTENPRQFRSPRPTIRRNPAPEPDASAVPLQHPADISEDVSAAV
jgi:hypothetical protein